MNPFTQPEDTDQINRRREWTEAQCAAMALTNSPPQVPYSGDGPDRENGGIDWIELNREFSL